MVFGDLSSEVIYTPPPPSTVPSAPPAPTVRTISGQANDYITIIEPTSDGGSEITSYNWECSDGKIGTRIAPGEFSLAQEAGTSQTYRVRAVNQYGTSDWSANSQSVTTPTPAPTFSFSPFGAFGFTPACVCVDDDGGFCSGGDYYVYQYCSDYSSPHVCSPRLFERNAIGCQ
jgi:hypothetical protein